MGNNVKTRIGDQNECLYTRTEPGQRCVMTSWRQFVCLGLVVGLLHLSLVDVAQAAEPTASSNPAAVKQQVNLLGVGAKVKVRLTDGKKLNGAIQGIEERAFLLGSKASSPRSLAYEQVAQLRFAKETYKVGGAEDAAEARRVLAGLGIGRHIVVKTAEGKEYHGNVLAIDRSHFSVLPDGQMAPVQFAYTDLVQLGPNLSKGAKVALIVALALVGAYLIWFAVAGPR